MTATATDIEYAKWICETKLTFKRPKDARSIARERLAADQSIDRLFIYRCPACRCYSGALFIYARRWSGCPVLGGHPSAPYLLAIASATEYSARIVA